MRQIGDIKLIIVVLDMYNIILFHFYVVFVEIIIFYDFKFCHDCFFIHGR